MQKVKSKWIYILFIVFAFFPYVQILPLGTDSQPNTLLLAGVIFALTFKGTVPKKFWGFLLISLASVLILFFTPITFDSFRSLSNYLGLFFIAYATYFVLTKLDGLPYSLFCKIVYIWFIVGTVQLFVYHEFLSFLIPRGDTEQLLKTGRGINCLTPEPTFYGLTCIMMGMFAFINYRKQYKLKRIYILLAIQLILYSRSTLSIFILMGAFVFYYVILFFRNGDVVKSISKLAIIGVLVYSLTILAKDFLIEYRVGRLLILLMEKPQLFLVLDSSVNERFVHLFFPIYAFVSDFGIPHGYNTFDEYMQMCFGMPKFYDIITPHVIHSEINRILSGLGSTLYELGIFGFIFIIYLYKLFKNALKGKAFIIIFILFIFIMANAMTFSNAMVAFFIGNILYLGNVNLQSEVNNEDSSN